MLISLTHLSQSDQESFDVVVVGAGAVGLTLAVSMARRKMRVLLLEAGPGHLGSTSQGLFEAAVVAGRDHAGLAQGRFRMLGGTSNFWGGQLVPFGPQIFGPRPWMRADTAWPIAPADLAVFERQVFDLLGMTKVIESDEEVSERIGARLPPLDPALRYFYSRWVPQPNLAQYFGPELRSSESLVCLTGTQVTALTMTDDRITGLEIADATGTRRTIKAQRVVLANGTIEIARLLLAPLAHGGPAPWNGNRWLGRGFMDHLDVTAGQLRIINKRAFSDAFENAVIDGIKYQPKIMLKAEAQSDRYVDIGAHLIFNSTYAAHYENAKIFMRSFLRGRLDRDLKSYPAKIYSLLRFGTPMAWRYLRSNRIAIMADQSIDLRLTAEQIMVAESGVALSARRDALGLPILELDWRVDGRELDTMAHFTGLLARSLRGSGIAEVDIDPRLAARDPAFLDGARDSNHHMGMARMAVSGEDGVVDPELRVFGTRNLFVAGAAVYPSTGFPNPTLTALALALRLGDLLTRSSS